MPASTVWRGIPVGGDGRGACHCGGMWMPPPANPLGLGAIDPSVPHSLQRTQSLLELRSSIRMTTQRKWKDGSETPAHQHEAAQKGPWGYQYHQVGQRYPVTQSLGLGSCGGDLRAPQRGQPPHLAQKSPREGSRIAAIAGVVLACGAEPPQTQHRKCGQRTGPLCHSLPRKTFLPWPMLGHTPSPTANPLRRCTLGRPRNC